jgi:hypothetical protein
MAKIVTCLMKVALTYSCMGEIGMLKAVTIKC